MEKSVTTFNKRLIKVSLMLIALSVFVSAVAMTQVVKADAAISLSPIGGVAGKVVNIKGDGFGDRTMVAISVGATEVTRTNSTFDGQIATYFYVPNIRYGMYTVTAVEKKYDRIAKTWTTTGNSATARFNVMPSGSSADASTPQPSTPSDTSITPIIPSTPSGTTIAGGEGDLGPLTIGLVAVALVAIFVPATAFYLRSSKRKSGYDDARPETPYDTPTLPPAPSRYQSTTGSAPSSYTSKQFSRPSVSTPYRQQSSFSSPTSRPFSGSRYSPSSSFSRPTTGTKICHSCHKAVRSDYSVCPYCHKVLR